MWKVWHSFDRCILMQCTTKKTFPRARFALQCVKFSLNKFHGRFVCIEPVCLIDAATYYYYVGLLNHQMCMH